MKKLIGIITFIFCAGMVFAQSAKYKELLNKAKQYEAKKEYAYALGFYYDAIEESPEVCNEAMEGWYKIVDAIEDGKPGLESYNAFTLHDAWRDLIINIEKYWTEYPPMGIDFRPTYDVLNNWEKFNNKPLVQDSLDYNTRTASYYVYVKTYETEKYKAIQGIIKKGLEKAESSNSDWIDIPKYHDWPSKSIFNEKDGTPQHIYQKYKVAVYVAPRTPYVIEYRIPSFVDGVNYHYRAGSIEDVERFKQKHRYAILGYSHRLQDIKFSVYDKNGKKILESGRHLLGLNGLTVMYDGRGGNNGKYTFKGVKPDIMSIIDSGEYDIKLDAYYMQYGTFNSNEIDFENLRAFVKNFPELLIPLENTEFSVMGERRKISY